MAPKAKRNRYKVDPIFADAPHTNPTGAEFNARFVIVGAKGIPKLALNTYLFAKAAGIPARKPETSS